MLIIQRFTHSWSVKLTKKIIFRNMQILSSSFLTLFCFIFQWTCYCEMSCFWNNLFVLRLFKIMPQGFEHVVSTANIFIHYVLKYSYGHCISVLQIACPFTCKCIFMHAHSTQLRWCYFWYRNYVQQSRFFPIRAKQHRLTPALQQLELQL